MKKDEPLLHATQYTQLTVIILNERNQTQRLHATWLHLDEDQKQKKFIHEDSSHDGSYSAGEDWSGLG